MDAFYAAIEQRDNPALLGRPVIVGSPPSRRGVVCAASYEARRFGVRSAMPSVTAGRLCPNGVFIPPRMNDYRAESFEIMRILSETGAVIEPMSIDEAYLDLSDTIAELASRQSAELESPDDALLLAIPLAKTIRKRISHDRRLTASIGVAANKFLAKLASDFQKPDGLTLIPERDKVQFLRPLPIRTIHGVGKVTEQALHQAGIRTVGDLQDRPGNLRDLVGSFGPQLKAFSLGNDDRPVAPGDEIKSISSEQTFETDTEDRTILRVCLLEQSEEITQKLRKHQLRAHTVQVKIRYSNFKTLTRQITVEDGVSDARSVYRLACHLLAKDRLVFSPLRLLGLGLSNFSDRVSPQMRLL
ncbi:MAG: DNA polymerase IV [Verrucomicrobia bacterium]|jgi:DNA polymerase IV|nr:DNA polymerase IV [Verrucomicrobiota bacterium]